jgi:DNA-binding MarR family transcriptional regulator
MEALQGAMRRLSDGVNLYESAVAERLGMHPTDLHFLGLVQLYGPTTAGHLAELGALTTGAVTGVLDRLEQAGYVRREPDPEDRRRVVVRMVEDSTSTVDRLYEPLRAASATVSERYSDDELATILDYADRLRPLVQEQASALRAGTARPVHRARGEDAGGATVLSAPVAGLTAATLRFPRGAGHLVVRGDPSLGDLFRAEFLSNVATAKVDGGVVNVQYRKSPFGWRAKHGELRLNASVTWQVEMVGGCTRFDARLAGVALTGLTVTGGVSHGAIELPVPAGVVPIRVTGGVNDLTVTRPAGTGAVLKVRGGAVNVTFDGQRSGAVGGTASWLSGEGADSDDRYEIEIVGGARTLVVTKAA